MYFPSPERIPANVTIREARDEDLDALEEIYLKVHPKDQFFDDFQKELRLPKSYLLVAEINQEIVGFGACDISGEQNRTHLHFGTVAPEWQRKGIGSILLLLRLALIDEDYDPAMVLFNAEPNMRPYYSGRLGIERIGNPVVAHGTELDNYGLWITNEEKLEIWAFIKSLDAKIPDRTSKR
jgi:GNAT superfamily N-acetyltransferase